MLARAGADASALVHDAGWIEAFRTPSEFTMAADAATVRTESDAWTVQTDDGGFAFGHAHHGLTLGPVTGRLLPEMMTGATPFADPRPYRPDRF